MMGSPECDTEDGEYTADLLAPASGPMKAPTEAPVLHTDHWDQQNQRRMSVNASLRKRSVGEEDSEWDEAEAEQKEILEQSHIQGRRASVNACERRRSLGKENEEWAEAETEQVKILQQSS